MQGFPTGVPMVATALPTPAQSNGAVTSGPAAAQPQEVYGTAQGAPPGALAHSMGPPPQPQHITVERGCQKKTRLVWTQELHMRFLAAVEKIGLRTAVPRTILQVMDVEGLTRENIASHLQKYRRLLEKKAGIAGPVSSKDWPKLEAVQTQHLQSLRKQLSEAQDAHPSAAPAAAAPTAEPAAAAMQLAPAAPAPAVHTPSTDAAAPSTPAPSTPMDAQPTPPPVAPTAELPAEHVPGVDMMWQTPASGRRAVQHFQLVEQYPPERSVPLTSQAQAQRNVAAEFPPAPTPAPCMPMPTMPMPHTQQLQTPGVCPVPAREPPSVPVPVGPDADGQTLGVPMPQSIVPPFMCVMPQHDGAPTLLPMLPAMYLAACGKNTPDTMGSVAIQHSQVPGMHPGAAHHPAAPMMQMPMHVHPYGMPMPGAMPGPMPGAMPGAMPYPMPMQPGPTMAAGAGQPMFPGFAPPMMHMPPMHRDAMGLLPEASPWSSVPAWRPPRHCKPTSTLPPLTADQPPPSAPQPGVPRLPQPTAVPHNISHEALPRVNSVASGQQPNSAGDEGSGGGGTAGVASNVQGIANIKLESDTEAPPPPLEPAGGVDVALEDMEVHTAMDMEPSDLGWPGWPDAGSSDELKPALGLETGLDTAVSSAAVDPMTDAFDDILGSPQKQDKPVGEGLE